MSEIKSNFTIVPTKLILSKISTGPFKILLYMLTWQNANGIFMSHQKISNDCSISMSGVKRAIEYLTKEKLIYRVSGKDVGKTNSYVINFVEIDAKCVKTPEQNEYEELELKRKNSSSKNKHHIKLEKTLKKQGLLSKTKQINSNKSKNSS